MDRFEVITDNGGELIQIRNLADGTGCWTKRIRVRRVDGAWVLVSERRVALREAARNRKVAKAAASTPEIVA